SISEQYYDSYLHIPSFPTRRSSDLMPTNTPKKIVVFLHGFKGFKDWGHFNEVMHFFAENNMVFVKFNFSHNGGTIDQPIDFPDLDRKSTRLNSSHVKISYAVFCLKK